MSAIDKYTPILDKEAAQKRYVELCALRDEIEAEVAPLRENLRKAADEAEVYRVKAMEARAKLDASRGSFKKWAALKREIGVLARIVSGTPVPPRQSPPRAAKKGK